MTELIVQFLAGLLRLVDYLVVLMTSVAVATPEAYRPGYGLDPRGLVNVLTRPVRAAARHARRLGIILLVAAIYVAAAWRS